MKWSSEELKKLKTKLDETLVQLTNGRFTNTVLTHYPKIVRTLVKVAKGVAFGYKTADNITYFGSENTEGRCEVDIRFGRGR